MAHKIELKGEDIVIEITPIEPSNLKPEILEEFIGNINKILVRLRQSKQILEEHQDYVKLSPPLRPGTIRQRINCEIIKSVAPCLENFNKAQDYLRLYTPITENIKFLKQLDSVRTRVELVKIEIERYLLENEIDLKISYVLDLNTVIIEAVEHINGVFKAQRLPTFESEILIKNKIKFTKNLEMETTVPHLEGVTHNLQLQDLSGSFEDFRRNTMTKGNLEESAILSKNETMTIHNFDSTETDIPILGYDTLKAYTKTIREIIADVKEKQKLLEIQIKLIKDAIKISDPRGQQKFEYGMIFSVGPCLRNYDRITPFLKRSMPIEAGFEFLYKTEVIDTKLSTLKLEVEKFLKENKGDLEIKYVTDLNMAILDASEHLYETYNTQLVHYENDPSK
jgi:hypothetical protein